jgi:hypothetical protein
MTGCQGQEIGKDAFNGFCTTSRRQQWRSARCQTAARLSPTPAESVPARRLSPPGDSAVAGELSTAIMWAEVPGSAQPKNMRGCSTWVPHLAAASRVDGRGRIQPTGSVLEAICQPVA